MVQICQNLPALLKLPCLQIEVQKPPFYTFDTLFWTPIFDLQNKNVDL